MTRCDGPLGHVFPGDAVAGTPCVCGQWEKGDGVRSMRKRPPPEITVRPRLDQIEKQTSERD